MGKELSGMEASVNEVLLRQLISSVQDVKTNQDKNTDSLNSVVLTITELSVTQKAQQDRLNSFWRVEWSNLLTDVSDVTARVSIIERQMSRGEGEDLSGKVKQLQLDVDQMKKFRVEILATSGAGSILGGAILWFIMNFLVK